MANAFDEAWLEPGAMVPVDISTTAVLIAEIIRLRSIAGKADVGPSFSELTDELRHQTPAE